MVYFTILTCYTKVGVPELVPQYHQVSLTEAAEKMSICPRSLRTPEQ